MKQPVKKRPFPVALLAVLLGLSSTGWAQKPVAPSSTAPKPVAQQPVQAIVKQNEGKKNEKFSQSEMSALANGGQLAGSNVGELPPGAVVASLLSALPSPKMTHYVDFSSIPVYFGLYQKLVNNLNVFVLALEGGDGQSGVFGLQRVMVISAVRERVVGAIDLIVGGIYWDYPHDKLLERIQTRLQTELYVDQYTKLSDGEGNGSKRKYWRDMFEGEAAAAGVTYPTGWNVSDLLDKIAQRLLDGAQQGLDQFAQNPASADVNAKTQGFYQAVRDIRDNLYFQPLKKFPGTELYFEVRRLKPATLMPSILGKGGVGNLYYDTFPGAGTVPMPTNDALSQSYIPSMQWLPSYLISTAK